MFQKTVKNGVPLYEVFCDIPTVSACITTRAGGVSGGEFATLNFRQNCEDTEENKKENVKRICASFGTSPEKIVTTTQEHTTVIRKVGKEDGGIGFVRPRFSEGVDGLITNEEDVTLFTFFADCVPVLLCDPVKRAVAAVHSGWRGTVGKISAEAVRKMKREFGSDSGDIRAVIGPHIGSCCFAVDRPCYDEFLAAFPSDNGFLKEEKDGKYYIDLSRAIQKTLRAEGVENIEDMEMCTVCRSEEFFSHRKTGGKRGCFAALIRIRDAHETEETA